jgi:DNA replication protein DnaC
MTPKTKIGERLPYLLSALKAPRIAERLAATAERAREEQWPYEQFLETLCEAEVFAREASRARTRTRTAGFPRTRRWRTSTSPPSRPPNGRW